MVEVIANSLKDTLIDGLSFKLAETASYNYQQEELHISSARLEYLHTSEWNASHED